MNVLNCKSCGRLFNAMSREKICPACRNALEDKFQDVKKYLEENPNSSVEQTAKDNDVSTKQIRQWVREERLILSSATDAGITCEVCGRPICSGRYCDQCKMSLKSDLMNALDRPNKPAGSPKPRNDGNRMRFLK